MYVCRREEKRKNKEGNSFQIHIIRKKNRKGGGEGGKKGRREKEILHRNIHLAAVVIL